MVALLLVVLVIGGVVAFAALHTLSPEVKPTPAAVPSAAPTGEPASKTEAEAAPTRTANKKGREGRRADKPISFTAKCYGQGGAAEPLVGIELSAAPALATGVDLEETVTARTDSAGIATFKDLPYTIYEVWVSPEGYLPLRLRGAKDGKELEFLFRKGVTFTGSVLDAETGAPIANAWIQLYTDFGMAATIKRIQMAKQQGVDPRDIQGYELLEKPHPFFRTSIESGADGKFTIPLAPFDTDVTLATEHPSFDAFSEVLKVRGSESIVRDIRLFPRVDIVGRVVVDETGEPVVGVKVQGTENGIPLSIMALIGDGSGGGVVEDVTDANGHFELRKLPRGKQYVTCNYPGYEDYVGSFEIKSTEKQFTHEIRLRRSASLSGTIVDNTSQPIEGVAVYWATAETQVMSNKGLPEKPHARTGPDGSFVLRGVPVTRTFNVLARHPDYVNAEKDHFVLQAGEELTGVEIMMSRGGAITGEVLDALRQPIPGATVLATPVKPPGAPLVPVLSSTDGSFLINNTQPAQFELTCEAPGYCKGTVGNVRDVSTGVQFVLVREAVYSGRFLTSGSEPITKFKVRCKASNIENAAIRTEQIRDKDGKFEVKGLVPGLWDFEFSAEGMTPLMVERVAMREAERLENQELRVAEGAKVGGVIRSMSGKPVQAALIRMEYLDAFDKSEKTYTKLQAPSNSNGEYEVKNLLPGRYLIWASHPSFAPLKEREIVVDVGPRQDIDFSMIKPASVRIVVRDAEGNTVPQATVWLFQGDNPMDSTEKLVKDGMVGIKLQSDSADRSGIQTADAHMQGGMKVQVGETGEVTFSRKEPGDWSIWVQCPSYSKYVAKLKLEAGKETIHEAELQKFVPGEKPKDAYTDRRAEMDRRNQRQSGGGTNRDDRAGPSDFAELTNEQREVLEMQKSGEELTAEQMAILKEARQKLRKEKDGDAPAEEPLTKEEKTAKRKAKADTDGDGKLSPEEREAMKKRGDGDGAGAGEKGRKGGRKGRKDGGADGDMGDGDGR
jgi:protocatechuate 3,4-dioxygenase beta subunit